MAAGTLPDSEPYATHAVGGNEDKGHIDSAAQRQCSTPTDDNACRRRERGTTAVIGHVVTVDKNRKQYIRRLGNQFGRTYQGASRLLEESPVTPVVGLRNEPHPDGSAFWQLIGITVKADDFDGVVLPGVDRHHPEVLRLHLVGNGEVVQFNPAWFTIAPMPDQTYTPPKGSRRKTHCPDGRPIYRSSELPGNVLATQTMLKHLRRRLPDDLKPIATYLGGQGGNNYHPLYAVADCIPMPELSPKRSKAWTEVRTCVWCGATNTSPWSVKWLRPGGDGLRLCGTCYESGRRQLLAAEFNAKRAKAERHVRTMLTHPATVVVVRTCSHDSEGSRRPDGGGYAKGQISVDRIQVTVVDHTGAELGEHTYERRVQWDGRGHGRHLDPDQAAIDALKRLRDVLTGRWMLDASAIGERDLIASDISQLPEHKGWEDRFQEARPDWGDGWDRNLGGQLNWIVSASRIAVSKLPRPEAGNYPQNWRQLEDQNLYHTTVGGDPPANAALMWWRILQLIAAGPHPAGPAVCPHQDSHKSEACGSADLTDSGFCAKHTGQR